MQKVIGTFKLKDKAPKSVKTIVGDSAIALKLNSGWNVQKFLKINIEELLSSFMNRADKYILGWDDGELVIHFFKEEEPVQYGCIRKVLPDGMSFYKEHVGKDMFLGDVIDVLYNTPGYTEKFLEDIEDVDAKGESTSLKERDVPEDIGEVLRGEPTDNTIN